MILTKRFEFDSAHKLSSELGEKETHLHGHRYVLEVSVKSEVGEKGFVISIADLKKVVNEEIVNKLDHANINNFVENSTMENITIWIWRVLKEKISSLYEIRLWETPNNSVTYKG